MSSGTDSKTLTSSESFYLRCTQLAFNMSQALSLRKLADIMHGTTSLSQQPAWILGTYYGVGNADADTKVLDAELLEAMLEDFRSRLWLTYRKDFTSLGSSSLTSDVGWGCTIRSGQMLLAEALARIALGRCWSRHMGKIEDVQPVVELFLDQPDAPLSIHNICAAGSQAGIVPGRWVGPWMLCKALDALFSQLGERRPMGLHLHVACGSGGGAPELYMNSIRARMASIAGAKAPPGPQLSCNAHAAAGVGMNGAGHCSSGSIVGAEDSRPCCQKRLASGAEAADPGSRLATEVASSSPSPSSRSGDDPGEAAAAERTHGSVSARDHVANGATEAPDDGGRSSGDGGQQCGGADAGVAEQRGGRQEARESCSSAPVLLLVPLTLGMDKLNPVYLPQLQRVLTWPQSVGIIGGRPSASLYLCGTQGGAFLYLDPHEAQPAVRPPAEDLRNHPADPAAAAAATAPPSASAPGPPQEASSLGTDHAGDFGPSGAAAAAPAAAAGGLPLPAAALASYFCEVARLLPGAALDPSMALGFLCTGPADLEDLFSRLAALALEHSTAPLMTLSEDAPEPEAEAQGAGGGGGGGAGSSGLDEEVEEEVGVGGRGAAGPRKQKQQQLEEWELV